jgi:hypothetical protein
MDETCFQKSRSRCIENSRKMYRATGLKKEKKKKKRKRKNNRMIDQKIVILNLAFCFIGIIRGIRKLCGISGTN